MTQAELRFLSIVPNELRDIREQLEKQNEILALMARIMNERK